MLTPLGQTPRAQDEDLLLRRDPVTADSLPLLLWPPAPGDGVVEFNTGASVYRTVKTVETSVCCGGSHSCACLPCVVGHGLWAVIV